MNVRASSFFFGGHRLIILAILLLITTRSNGSAKSNALDGKTGRSDLKEHTNNEQCIVNSEGQLESQACMNEAKSTFLSLVTPERDPELVRSASTRNFELSCIKRMTGRSCLKQDKPYGLSTTEWKEMSSRTFPDFYDHRDNKTICPSITEISGQGACDSCWAVVAADVMTDRLCLRTNGSDQRRVSAADLLSCCTDCFRYGGASNVCGGGGKQKKGWQHFVEVGIVTGHYRYSNDGKIGCKNYHIEPCRYLNVTKEEWKSKLLEINNETDFACRSELRYCPRINEEQDPKCNCTCDSDYTKRSYSEDYIRGEACYYFQRQFDQNEKVIKAEIMLNGPVHAFMTVQASLHEKYAGNSNNDTDKPYLGGPIDTEDPNHDKYCGGHSIRIVGWGKYKDGEKNDTSYWIAANSWGSEWGDMNGFFYLDFDHDKEQGGKEEVYAGIPKTTF